MVQQRLADTVFVVDASTDVNLLESTVGAAGSGGATIPRLRLEKVESQAASEREQSTVRCARWAAVRFRNVRLRSPISIIIGGFLLASRWHLYRWRVNVQVETSALDNGILDRLVRNAHRIELRR